MKLSECKPGTIVKYKVDPRNNKVNVGQITEGLELNSVDEVCVFVRWAGNISSQPVHPGNLELYKD